MVVQESVQANVQDPQFFLFFGPPGIKMNFEKNGLLHQVALFLGFLSSLKVSFVGLQILEIGSKRMILKK